MHKIKWRKKYILNLQISFFIQKGAQECFYVDLDSGKKRSKGLDPKIKQRINSNVFQ